MQEYKEFKLTERGKQRQIVKPDFAERIKDGTQRPKLRLRRGDCE